MKIKFKKMINKICTALELPAKEIHEGLDGGGGGCIHYSLNI